MEEDAGRQGFWYLDVREKKRERKKRKPERLIMKEKDYERETDLQSAAHDKRSA